MTPLGSACVNGPSQDQSIPPVVVFEDGIVAVWRIGWGKLKQGRIQEQESELNLLTKYGDKMLGFRVNEHPRYSGGG